MHTPRPISKGLDDFLYACVCLLASVLYIYVCLPRSRFLLALFPLQACACRSLGPLAYVVAFVPLVACSDVIACETHLRDVGVLDTHPSLLSVILLSLPCLLGAIRLTFFASSYLCTFAYLFMHKSLLACVIKPNFYYLV